MDDRPKRRLMDDRLKRRLMEVTENRRNKSQIPVDSLRSALFLFRSIILVSILVPAKSGQVHDAFLLT